MAAFSPIGGEVRRAPQPGAIAVPSVPAPGHRMSA